MKSNLASKSFFCVMANLFFSICIPNKFENWTEKPGQWPRKYIFTVSANTPAKIKQNLSMDRVSSWRALNTLFLIKVFCLFSVRNKTMVGFETHRILTSFFSSNHQQGMRKDKNKGAIHVAHASYITLSCSNHTTQSDVGRFWVLYIWVKIIIESPLSNIITSNNTI